MILDIETYATALGALEAMREIAQNPQQAERYASAAENIRRGYHADLVQSFNTAAALLKRQA